MTRPPRFVRKLTNRELAQQRTRHAADLGLRLLTRTMRDFPADELDALLGKIVQWQQDGTAAGVPRPFGARGAVEED